MKKGKSIETRINNEEYLKIVPKMAYYLKNENIGDIWRYKSPLFIAAGEKGRIYLFSNSLEHMGSLNGHKSEIWCLTTLTNGQFASGSEDNTIKIWNIKNRGIISTLTSGHKDWVTALCDVSAEILVSGSKDNSLIIWNKLPGYSTYSPKQIFTEHKSVIRGILRINNQEIISGDGFGDIRVWNIDQGVCIRYIPKMALGLWNMKLGDDGEIVVSYWQEVAVFAIANNWGDSPLKQFRVCYGRSIEFLSEDLLLRGGFKGELKFIDYAQTGNCLPWPIKRLHKSTITDIQRIAKNIVVTVAADRSIKVLDPISKVGYLNYKCDCCLRVIGYLY